MIKKNTFKKDIEALGFSYKKVITILILSNLFFIIISVILYFFLKNFIFLLLGFLLSLIVDVYVFNYFNSLKIKLIKDRENEFITLLSYFEIYIDNNFNVYNSFIKITNFASPWMKENIISLSNAIDQDKSVKPYIDFSNNFPNKIVQSVMLSIFQMVDNGENLIYINRFHQEFTSINKNKMETLIAFKKRKIESMNIFPLVGAGLITVLLTVSILLIIGGLLNG